MVFNLPERCGIPQGRGLWSHAGSTISMEYEVERPPGSFHGMSRSAKRNRLAFMCGMSKVSASTTP